MNQIAAVERGYVRHLMLSIAMGPPYARGFSSGLRLIAVTGFGHEVVM